MATMKAAEILPARLRGARAIAEAMAVTTHTVYSWAKRDSSPIPMWKTPDGRLWVYEADVLSYWKGSTSVGGMDAAYRILAEAAVEAALGAPDARAGDGTGHGR